MNFHNIVCSISPTGCLALGGSIFQKPQAILPVDSNTANQQWWSCIQQGEGDDDQVSEGSNTTFTKTMKMFGYDFRFIAL